MLVIQQIHDIKQLRGGAAVIHVSDIFAESHQKKVTGLFKTSLMAAAASLGVYGNFKMKNIVLIDYNYYNSHEK